MLPSATHVKPALRDSSHARRVAHRAVTAATADAPPAAHTVAAISLQRPAERSASRHDRYLETAVRHVARPGLHHAAAAASAQPARAPTPRRDPTPRTPSVLHFAHSCRVRGRSGGARRARGASTSSIMDPSASVRTSPSTRTRSRGRRARIRSGPLIATYCRSPSRCCRSPIIRRPS